MMKNWKSENVQLLNEKMNNILFHNKTGAFIKEILFEKSLY